MKLSRLALAVVALAAVAAGGAATAQSSGLYYHYTYYSDASKTVVVGQISERCTNGYIVMPYAPEVVFTDHYDRYAIGNCPGLGDW